MNFDVAREAMVECQLMPSGITEQAVLDAFSAIPREAFMPEKYQGIAYQDKDILFSNGRDILAPTTFAKLIKALDVSPEDIVLCLGDISGYAAAILSSLVSTVVRVEEDPHALDFADQLYQSLDMLNVVSIQGDISKGDNAHAPFDKIILCGASAIEPNVLMRQLSPSGVLSYIYKTEEHHCGYVSSVTSVSLGEFERQNHGEVAACYCLGYEPKKKFAF